MSKPDLTFVKAKVSLRERGFTLTKRDGEYRLCRYGDPETEAYYTNSLDDAIGTSYQWDAPSLQTGACGAD